MRRLATLALLTIAGSCVRHAPAPMTAAPRLARGPGSARYQFTSTQETPAGSHHVRVTFRLITKPGGDESAEVTAYEHADGDRAYAPGQLDPSCVQRLGGSAGVLARLSITPPPRDMGSFLPDCVPEDFWGAASDILPLLMIQVQPAFRAAELRRAGQRLAFRGYDAHATIPPNVLDQRIVADSGVIALDSLQDGTAVLSWDTSPMRVHILRRLPNGMTALFEGAEWFVAEVRVNARNGVLLGAFTRADSLRLRMTGPFTGDSPPAATTASPGPEVRIIRRLELIPLPD